jgi:hypothetical protein
MRKNKGLAGNNLSAEKAEGCDGEKRNTFMSLKHKIIILLIILLTNIISALAVMAACTVASFNKTLDKNDAHGEQIEFLTKAIYERMKKNDGALSDDLKCFMDEFCLFPYDEDRFWRPAKEYFPDYFQKYYPRNHQNESIISALENNQMSP